MKNENDIKIAITIVEQFKDFSGLKLIRQKYDGICMGSRKHDRDKINDIPMKERIKKAWEYNPQQN